MTIHESKVEGVTVRLINRSSESAFLAAYAIWDWLQTNNASEAYVSDLVKALESMSVLGETSGARDQNIRRACDPAAQVGSQVLRLVSGGEQKRLYQKTKKIVMTTGILETLNLDTVEPSAQRTFRVEPITPPQAAPVSFGGRGVAPMAPAPQYAPHQEVAASPDMTAIFAAMRAAGFAPPVAAPTPAEPRPPATLRTLQEDQTTTLAAVATGTDLSNVDREAFAALVGEVLKDKRFDSAIIGAFDEVWERHFKIPLDQKLRQNAELLASWVVEDTVKKLLVEAKDRLSREFGESKLAQERSESAHLRLDGLRPTIDGLRATTEALRVQLKQVQDLGLEPRLMALETNLRQVGKRLVALETGALS